MGAAMTISVLSNTGIHHIKLNGILPLQMHINIYPHDVHIQMTMSVYSTCTEKEIIMHTYRK